MCRTRNGIVEADRFAKTAVKQHRLERTCVERWRRVKAKAKQTAMCTARMAELANHVPKFPFRDPTASRMKAMGEARVRARASRARDREAMHKRRNITTARPKQFGRRQFKQTRVGPRMGWRRTCCKVSSAPLAGIAQSKWQGSLAMKWSQRPAGPRHVQVLNGSAVWCMKSGAYGDAKAIGLFICGAIGSFAQTA